MCSGADTFDRGFKILEHYEKKDSIKKLNDGSEEPPPQCINATKAHI